MKKIFFLIISLFFISCSQTTQYNVNSEVPNINNNINIKNPLQKTFIYVDSADLKTQKIKPSTSLGEDDLSINLGEYSQKSCHRFFKTYLANIELTSDKKILETDSLIILPSINSFEYGFYSYDGFNVDSKPFVNYNFQLSIYKNKELIYSKDISANGRKFGEKVFFGMGSSSYSQIGPILQKAIANDYNNHAVQILDAINKVN